MLNSYPVMMQVTYKQTFLPTKRHRIPRDVYLRTNLTGCIKVVDKENFPIAMRVSDRVYVYSGEYKNNVNYELFTENLRLFENCLYKQYRYEHGTAVCTDTIPEESFFSVFEREWGRYGNALRIVDRELDPNAILLDNNLDAVKNDFAKYLDDYLICDGVLYIKTPEPMYVIYTFGLGHNHGGTGFFIEYYYNPNIPNSNYFNALQRDEAIKYFEKVALGRGDDWSIRPEGYVDNIEVLIPEAVKHVPIKEHGEGDPFMNRLEAAISGSTDLSSAALLTMALTVSEIA